MLPVQIKIWSIVCELVYGLGVWICALFRRCLWACVCLSLCIFVWHWASNNLLPPRPSETDGICLAYSHRLYSCYPDVHLKRHSAVHHFHDHVHFFHEVQTFSQHYILVASNAYYTTKFYIIYTNGSLYFSCNIIEIYFSLPWLSHFWLFDCNI